MVKITGQKAHKARLKRIRGAAMVREVGKAIFEAGEFLTKEAQISITTGSTSAKGKHVPSAPGTPPNNDSGHLADNIETHRTGDLTAESTSNAEYAAAHEFGNSRLPARPYMQPAADRTRPEAQAKVVRAVKRVVKGGTL